MAVKHGVKDTDKHFVIDPVTRTIKNESGKLTLIRYDHNSERFTFEVPRYVDNHDMSACNKVEIHYVNVGKGNSKNNGLYEVDDLQVSSDDENVVTCSWLISQNATQHVGTLNFVIRFACIDDEGIVEYAWNTSIYQGIAIANSIYNSEVIIEEYADVLEQWKQELYSEGLKIRKIEQTGYSTEPGGINVITVTMTDGSVSAFSIQNGLPGGPGSSIANIKRTVGNGASGSTDTYTVTLTDGSTSNFQVYNGKDGSNISGITRTSGDGSPGSIDTYTVTLTDGSTSNFQVYNGKNGARGDGSGDMIASTYDPQNKNTDIFAYVDDAVDNINVDITISDSVTTDSSTTAASSTAVKLAYDKAEEALQAAENDDIFYATYGSTTNTELEAAYVAGKKIYCLTTSGGICPLYMRYSSDMWCFYKGAAYFYYMNNDGWTTEDNPYVVGDKTDMITSASKDTDIPSAKAVYTFVNNAIAGAIGGGY